MRTGCKYAFISESGSVLTSGTFFPNKEREEVASKLLLLLDKHRDPVIALGNGKGSREAEELIRQLILPKAPSAKLTIIDESVSFTSL